MRKNVDLVKPTRELLGPDGDIMLDCWMALTERYTVEMAAMVEPYRVYWMEECLQPHDYEGFGRLNAQIKSTRIATGEHEYTLLRFPPASGAPFSSHLAAGHSLVRRPDGIAPHRRTRGGLRHPRHSARRAAMLDCDRIRNMYPGGGGYAADAFDVAYTRAMLQAALAS